MQNMFASFFCGQVFMCKNFVNYSLLIVSEFLKVVSIIMRVRVNHQMCHGTYYVCNTFVCEF